MTVDVVTKSHSADGISVTITASETALNDINRPIRLYAEIMQDGLPLVGAGAVAELYMPGDLQVQPDQINMAVLFWVLLWTSCRVFVQGDQLHSVFLVPCKV